MVAHALLISLLQIVEGIHHPARGQQIYHNRAQLRSLHEEVTFLLDFLQNSSSDYWKLNDMELESLETKIRLAASKAKLVIESDISYQLLQASSANALIALLLIVGLFGLSVHRLSYKLFQVILFRASLMGVNAFLISVQFLSPPSSFSYLVSLQTIQCIVDRILDTIMVHSFLILCVVTVSVGYVMQIEILKWTSFARYWLYASAPENQDLCGAIDDFSVLVKEVIKIKDACGSVRNLGNHRTSSADRLSTRDFRGIGKNVVVGLDDQVKEIYDRLLGYQQELQIVSIVGMGGIGKTTLAKQVRDDPHIVYHFDICAWITVSQKYSLRHIMLGLLDSAKIHTEEILQDHKECEDVLDQKLGEHLYKNLMRRRYLIVMDDVWDKKVLDFVRIFFPDNSNGSRVLLTTRLSEVASYANSGSTSIHMRFLNDNDSWNLLREKVFGEERCPPEIEAIGKIVSRNCRGLPLAIVVVGGLLYNEHKTVQEWERVSNNLNTILTKEDTQCPEILRLSYNHLPHRLKPCFLYMGSFHEDEEIHVNRLFNLWVAE